MDIVVPVGPNTVWAHNELRFALRSIDKHCLDGYDNIFIVGEKPKFIEFGDKVKYVDFRPDLREAKELRIWANLVAACKDERVSKEFFFTNDDYFFLQPFEIRNFPFYHKGDLSDLELSDSGYQGKAKRTRKTLEKLKLPTLHFDIHRPNRVNKQDFLVCYAQLRHYIEQERYSPNGGMLINTTYLNWKQEVGEYAQECKVKDISEVGTNQLVFSIYDEAVNNKFKQFCQEFYPERLPFEIMSKEREINSSEKISVRLNSRFVYNGQQFGKGKWRLNRDLVEKFLELGKVESVEGDFEPTVKEEPKVNEPKTVQPLELPEDFPFREKLIESGFSTIESLKKNGVEKELLEIKGFGQSTVTKIGIELAKY